MAIIGVAAGQGQPVGIPGIEPTGPARSRAASAGSRLGRAVRSNRKATAGAVLLAFFCLIALLPLVSDEAASSFKLFA